MSRKNNLLKFKNIDAESMNADIVSDITCIQWLDNIGIQLNFSGIYEGAFAVEVSLDHAQDSNGNVTDAGNWVPLSLNNSTSISTAVGSPIYVDLNQLSSPWIRVSYTNSYLEPADITTVADSSGSLNNKYFLIDGADGTDWYVWFNVNSAGVDPALPGRTGIEVALATNDSANTVATAIQAALVACTSITSIGGATDHVTFTQDVPGVGSVTNGAASPGFTISYVSGTGVVSGYISAKMI